MARGQLSFIGISQSKPSEGDTNRLTDIVEKTAINGTAYGKVNTVQDAQTVIEALKRAPQTLYTQEKILDYENKKEQLLSSAQDMMMSKNNFQEEVESKLKDAAKRNINNPRQMMAEYAQIYSDYADAYDSYIDDKVLNQYGSDTTLPADVVAFGQSLKENASFHAGLYNSYNFADSEGNLGANAFGDSIDTNAVAMLVQTNPTTGKISNVKYVPANQVPEGFMRTDIQSNVYGSQDAPGMGQNKLPVFVQGYAVPGEDGKVSYEARLGSLQFKTSAASPDAAGKLTLELQGDDSFLGFGGDAGAKSVRKDGLYLNDQSFTFDKNDIPNYSIVRAGAKTFFQGGDGGLYEIKGADDKERAANLDAYYRKWGVNPANVRDFFADKTYLNNDDGTSRVTGVIDKSTTQIDPSIAPPVSSAGGSSPLSFGAPQTRGVGVSDVLGFAAKAATRLTPVGAAIGAAEGAVDVAQSFFNRKNRPVAAAEPAASRGGNISAPDVVEAGKSFFRGIGNKLGIG